MSEIDADAAWAAFSARDRSRDGAFVVAVRTTGIYCRPSCPARRPARAHVAFLRDGAAARAAGYRPCLRCTPDSQARDARAVAEAIGMIEAAIAAASEGAGGGVTLAALAAAVGYAPHHFQRLFVRATGMSPAAYARGRRADRAAAALAAGGRVTDAVYAAGYGAPSRFYATGAARLGMTPRTRAKGGAGETIRWTQVTTSLGPLLVAATGAGLCRIAFDMDARALAAEYPQATIVLGDASLAALAAEVVALVETPARAPALPTDVRGTAFQEAVWQALATIPPGETRSYAELAAAAGRPGATRAAGTACGRNPLAVLVPCHRVTRGDGAIGGYAWGPERKRALLARERERERT